MKNLFLFAVLLVFSIAKSQTVIVSTSNITSGTISANSNQQDEVVIHDAGATLTLTIAMPPNPVNGQKYTFCSSGGIVGLTLSSVIGTVQNAVTTLAAGGNATYMYSSSNNKWYKIR